MVRIVAAVARLVRALLALTVLVGFTAGVPWLLTLVTGWPLKWIGWTRPTAVPTLADLVTATTSPWSDEMVLALLATCGWVLWLLFVRDVIAEVIAAFTNAAAIRAGRPRPSVSRRGPLRWVAAFLVGAIIGAVLLDTVRTAVGASGASASAAAANAAAHRPAVAVASANPSAVPMSDLTGEARPALADRQGQATSATPVALTAFHREADVPAWAANAPGGVHHVVRDDNLWNIAKQHLGNPYRWREIYVLNRGHVQANGYALTDPDEIHIGWILALPARDPSPAPSAPAERPESRPATAPSTGSAATPSTAPLPSQSANTAPSATPTANGSVDGAATPTPAGASPVSSAGVTTAAPSAHDNGVSSDQHEERGVALPSQGWISLGLAGSIAAVAALLRLHARRRARLGYPIPLRTGPAPAPVPDSLHAADAAGSRVLATRDHGALPGLLPVSPKVPAPIGIDERGDEISLFEVPGSVIALDGDGAPAAARAIVAAVLATGVTDRLSARPILVAPADTLARLLPDGVAPNGLDPRHETYDGERLIVVADTATAVTQLETEMIHRRRLLDSMSVDSANELNARRDHAEHLPPYVLLVPADHRYIARILAVAAQRAALHLHPVIIGTPDGAPDVARLLVAAGGTFTVTSADGGPADWSRLGGGRLAVLAARDLADALGMIAIAAPRPETGDEPVDPQPDSAARQRTVDLSEIPASRTDASAPVPVRLTVLGPPTLATTDGPITSGLRRGSLAVLAVLAAHPRGRTFEELAADLHPNTDPETGVNRVSTDLNAVRSLLREATGVEGRGRFVVHDGATGQYRIDPDLIEVDLWRMLSAIDRANKAGDDDAACLAALREAVACYGGDFAEGQDRAWVIDYAATYRHHLLNAYARIAEILEVDQPDQALAALEQAIERDPVNEELYQRVMRIQGRLGRPDAVRRTLRLLEDRLADLGEAEPTEATRRVAERQLRPVAAGGHR